MANGSYKGAFSRQPSKDRKGSDRSTSGSTRTITVGNKMTLSDRFRSVSQKGPKRQRGGIAKMTGIEGPQGTAPKDVEMKTKPKFNRKKRRVTKQSLDSELDTYMMKDAEVAKSKLDLELDDYMKDVNETNK